MPSLVKLIFTGTTGSNAASRRSRTGSWSEGFWHSSNDKEIVRTAVEVGAGVAVGAPLTRRLFLLPTDFYVSAFRVQAYNLIDQHLIPTGGSKLTRVDRKGSWAGLNDIPGMACEVNAGFVGHDYRTKFTLRGIPDAQVEGGELSLADGWRQGFERYLRSLAGAFGSVITDRRTAPRHRIRRITNAGVISGQLAIAGIAVGALVSVTRSRDSCNVGHGGVFRVTARDLAAGTITIAGWPHGESTGGSVMLYERLWAQYDVDQMDHGRAVPRKVGGPFARFVGRRKARSR